MKKFAVGLAFILAVSTLLSACGSDDNGGGSSDGEDKGGKGDFKAAMVTDTGGVDDKSFNQSAWEGLQKFGKDNDLKKEEGYKYLQSKAATDYAPNLNQLVRNDYNLIFGIGFLMVSDVRKVAQQHKDAQFALVDDVVTKSDDSDELVPNVASLTFKEHQGSFLVGVIAGLMTDSNKVGFVGGVESALIKKFESGFVAGVKTVNPDAEVYRQYSGSFDDTSKAASVASTMYGKGADIIYHSAGNSGNGVFTEAKNRKKSGDDVWVIGVDRDQYDEGKVDVNGKEENVTLTSMVKRVDKAVDQVSKQTKDGDFPGGKEVVFGLKDDGVGISSHHDNVSDEALQEVKKYKKKILDGDLDIPKTDDELKKYLDNL